MKSIRTKITFLTVCAIIAAMLAATLMGAAAIRNLGKTYSEKLLMSLCESGEKNLDSYFTSAEQAVDMVCAYAEADLEATGGTDQLEGHLARVKEIFSKVTFKTNGVLTYYYRIDPGVSRDQEGFWFVNLDGVGFREHRVTDIWLYDTDDTTSLVWFTVAKAAGKPVWLPPYITDNLNMRVISYDVPIYWDNQFLGVIGIEIDYSTMADQVNNISLYNNGYAFVTDSEGKVVYHPRMDVTAMEAQPEVPKNLLQQDSFVSYTFEGIEKLAVRLPLSNGMQLCVTVPVSEINADWHRLVYNISLISLLLLLVFILASMRVTSRITEPLMELTKAARRMNEGDYNCQLEYRGNDEVGVLTTAFIGLIAHLKSYISGLNDLAYADALTSVRNKGAFDIFIQKLQAQLQQGGGLEFAICVFDCNGLKAINDHFGHEKGDIYLKTASSIICHVYEHSPVFRIGGDEFTVVLQGQDYLAREKLLGVFDEACDKKRAEARESWEKVFVARGMAVYAPQEDGTVNDVLRRADKLMYDNKLLQKGSPA